MQLIFLNHQTLWLQACPSHLFLSFLNIWNVVRIIVSVSLIANSDIFGSFGWFWQLNFLLLMACFPDLASFHHCLSYMPLKYHFYFIADLLKELQWLPGACHMETKCLSKFSSVLYNSTQPALNPRSSTRLTLSLAGVLTSTPQCHAHHCLWFCFRFAFCKVTLFVLLPLRLFNSIFTI